MYVVKLEVGDRFPEMELTGTKGDISLEGLKGKNVVVYFYPRDSTPGCTKEAKDFRDLGPEFERLNTEIIGISTNSLKSHRKFAERYELDFNLLSDDSKLLCAKCGVIGTLGRSAKRTTFLLDGEGIIRHIWAKVSVRGHAQAVLEKARLLNP